MYLSKDLGPAEEHLRLFFMQYWGGPRTYDERRGHPRLRMRHAHFSIGEAERDAWLRHMRAPPWTSLTSIRNTTPSCGTTPSYNVVPEHSTRIYDEMVRLHKPVSIYLHTGGHGGNPPADMVKSCWFSHYLYGVDNGVEKDAPVWIVQDAAMQAPLAVAAAKRYADSVAANPPPPSSDSAAAGRGGRGGRGGGRGGRGGPPPPYPTPFASFLIPAPCRWSSIRWTRR